MAGTNNNGMLFDKSGTATSTETTAANAKWDANGCRPRRVSLTNDGAIDLSYRFSIDAEPQMTLAPGENVVSETISNGLQVVCASSCAFRATAEG